MILAICATTKHMANKIKTAIEKKAKGYLQKFKNLNNNKHTQFFNKYIIK